MAATIGSWSDGVTGPALNPLVDGFVAKMVGPTWTNSASALQAKPEPTKMWSNTWEFPWKVKEKRSSISIDSTKLRSGVLQWVKTEKRIRALPWVDVELCIPLSNIEGTYPVNKFSGLTNSNSFKSPRTMVFSVDRLAMKSRLPIAWERRSSTPPLTKGELWNWEKEEVKLTNGEITTQDILPLNSKQ